MTDIPRKPWLAGLLSFFTIGLGHIYTGEARKGIFLFLGQGIFLIVFLPLFLFLNPVNVLAISIICTEQPQTDLSPIETTDEIIQRRAEFLCDYQDKRLSERYLALVNKVRTAEEAIIPGAKAKFTKAVARSYFKTLAYKDEYEVARLYTDTGFLDKIKKDYGSQAKLHFNLAPPILGGDLDARGRPRKREFGAWLIPVFRLLAKMRKLRGSRFDLFGMTVERKMERALIGEFESNVDLLLQRLTAVNVEFATEIVNEYLEIRGYGPVKEAAARDARTRIETKLKAHVNITEKAA